MRVAVYILAGVFLLAVLLDKTLHSLPAKELRRRVRTKHDKRAAALYKLSAFGRSSDIFIHLVGILSAGVIIVMATRTAWWVGLLVILPAMWLVWNNRPKSSDEWEVRIAAIAAPFFSAMVALLHPLLSRLFFWQRRSATPPTGIYEKEDLIDFLRLQARQPDSRISALELKTARGALSLGDKTVGEIMLPRRKVKAVAASEPIGPILMDELHKSGQLRFPVVREVTRSANPEIIGALYLKDLLDRLEDKGRIRDIMHQGVSFINESQNLLEAIDGFLKSGQLLLVVVNNFEEVVGVITLEDVLQQIFGDKIHGEFDHYHDIRSVANRDSGQNDSQPTEAKVE